MLTQAKLIKTGPD